MNWNALTYILLYYYYYYYDYRYFRYIPRI